MKISIVYFSKSGYTKRMAEIIKKGMEKIEHTQVETMPIDKIDENFIKESSCVIVGTPTYYASMASELKCWLDTKAKLYGLPGKLGGAFSTARYVHGGGCIALQNIMTHLTTMGMLTYSGGGSYENATIHLGPVAINDQRNEQDEYFSIYGEEMARMAKKLFSK